MISRNSILLTIIAFVAIFFIPKISLAQVLINEIFSDPAGTDTGLEWIELYNSGTQTADIGGWQINGSGKYFTIPSFSFGPSSYLLLRWRADGQNTANEIFTGASIIDANLGNTSGFIALFKSAQHSKDTIVDYVEYGKAGQTLEATAASAGIWQKEQFVPAAAENQSLGLKQNGLDQNLVSDWQIFSSPTPLQANGTVVDTPQQAPPQQPNEETPASSPSETSSPSVYVKYSDKVRINEFMPWPASGSEWVELFNSGDQIIDLSDWQIDDVAQASQPYKISSGTLISPGQYLVIELGKQILNNDGDEVRLIWSDGQLISSVSYQDAQSGMTSSRFEDGWFSTDQPTPGQENKKSVQKSSPPQTENIAQQNEPSSIVQNTPLIEKAELPSTPPSIAAISEAVSQEKNEDNSNKNTIQAADANPIGEQNSPLNQIAASQSSAVQQVAARNSGLSPVIALAAIFTLSLLSGIGIVYFKRKKAIDSVQKP